MRHFLTFASAEKLPLALALALAALFLTAPQLDIATTALFYKNGFYLRGNFLLNLAYDYTQELSIALGAAILATAIFALALKKRALFKSALFLALSGILGPLIVINGALKSFIGRARPRDTTDFGGEHPYTKIFDLSANYCDGNCSFVCGHCSAGFVMIAFAYLFSGPGVRRAVFGAGFLYGVFVSFSRVAQGGHFLSDAVFAFFFTYFCIKIAYFLVFKKPA